MDSKNNSYQSATELSLRNAVAEVQAGSKAIAQGQLNFDLTALAVVDSAAVAVLLEWQRAARALGKTIHFQNIPASLESLIALYGVSELLTTPASGRH